MAPSARKVAPEHVARVMLSWHSLELVSCERLQNLWAGYGQICALSARAQTDAASAVLNRVCGGLETRCPSEVITRSTSNTMS